MAYRLLYKLDFLNFSIHVYLCQFVKIQKKLKSTYTLRMIIKKKIKLSIKTSINSKRGNTDD